jgi:hypothetical protein
MKFDSSVIISGDLIEPFRPALIAFQVTRKWPKSFGLTGHLGHVGLQDQGPSCLIKQIYRKLIPCPFLHIRLLIR